MAAGGAHAGSQDSARRLPRGNFPGWVPTLGLLPCGGGGTLPPCPHCPAGFIDFIVEPTFSVLTDVAEKSVQPLVDDDSKSKNQPR